MANQTPPRVRIAPSPTGAPHVGTAYIALFNRAFAKKHGGQFILRIEDTDQQRSRPEYEEQIFAALKSVGLDWDEGPDVGGPHAPYRQSERTELYQQHAQQLIDKGRAYKCWCTPDRLDELREQQKAQQKEGKKVRLGYDKHCLSLSDDEKAKLDKSDQPYVVRFDIPDEGDTTFCDRVRGDVTWANVELDDKVLLKSDGFPTYHLANVVDDHLMGITHVLRAEEWIASTPLHVLLYDGFGWDAPVFCHMPLLRNKGGGKISKRKNPVSLGFYASIGILPEALLNFLGLQGYSMPEGVLAEGSEKFDQQTFIDNFDLDRITKTGPVFDLDKLRSINSEHIQALSPEEFRQRVLDYTSAQLDRVGGMLQPRLNTLADWSKDTWFYSAWDIPLIIETFAGATKRIEAPKLAGGLKAFCALIQNLQPHEWTADMLEDLANQVRDQHEWTAKKDRTAFMQGIRIAVAGRPNTPGLGDTLVAMERYSVVSRLEAAVALLKA